MRRALLLTSLLPVLAAAALAGGQLAVTVSGKPRDPVPTYDAGSEVYLDASKVGGLFGGQVYWYPVSGRIQLSLRGRTMQFVADSDEAAAGDETFKLPAPVKVRASRAFIPLSFLRTDAFARWSGFESRYNPATKTLEVEKRGTVGPPRSFSYKSRTRVVVALAPGVSWRTAGRGVGGVEVLFPLGAAEGDERVELDDGVIDHYAVKQEARQAKLSVRFARDGQRWRAAELSDPRRLALDVYAAGVEPPDAAPAPGAAESRRAEPAAPKAEAKPAPAAAPAAAAASAGAAAAPAAVPAVPTPAVKKRRLVVIDAGHGGKDPGAIGARGAKEKDINLAAALELARVLREHGDFDVALTREDDSFVPLSERSEKANAMNADLFVSLHCNSTSNRRESGFEVYSVSETASDPEAERLAAAENAVLELEGKNPQEEAAKLILLAMTKTEMINESGPFAALVQRALAKRVDVPDRGVKRAAFYVLRGTHAPSILVEMAFVSHPKDEAKLESRRFRRHVAEAVAAGIADYARKKEWLE